MTERGHTYTEAWRHECEVRYVVKMDGPESRRAFLDGVEKKRGKAAADRLRDGVRKVWETRNGAQAVGT